MTTRHDPTDHAPGVGIDDLRSGGRPSNPLVWLLVGLVRGYQLIVSPWFGPSCKYYPSCSAYAVTALRRHGAVRGTALAGWRLLRCNPWSLGGVDHVPERASRENPDRRAMHEVTGQPRTLGTIPGDDATSPSPTRGAPTAPQDS